MAKVVYVHGDVGAFSGNPFARVLFAAAKLGTLDELALKVFTESQEVWPDSNKFRRGVAAGRNGLDYVRLYQNNEASERIRVEQCVERDLRREVH